MSQTIAVLGATGVYARHLLPRLAAKGYAVRALVRRPEAAGVAVGCGADVRITDIFDPASLRTCLEGCAVAINLATTLPGPSGRGDFVANDRLRTEGTPLFLEACAAAGVARVIQQSIAMVNASGENLANEDTVYAGPHEGVAARAIAAALAMEEAVRATSLDWLVLRGGLFYGPGTGFDDDWFSRARAGKLRLPGNGEDYVSLAHIADMAEATVAALEYRASRKALNICDNAPARWRDVFGYIARLVGAEPPLTGGMVGFPSFRIDNSRSRRELNWSPFYGDHRAGLVR